MKRRLLTTILLLLSLCSALRAQSCAVNGHDYVDLGLPSGVLWATCNVGADAPEEFGNYYSWGECRRKIIYDVDSYNTACRDIDKSISGNKKYDVARRRWGAPWCIPTKSDFEELDSLCNWEWTAVKGIKGYKVTGRNGNSIFLPAAGGCVNDSIYAAGVEGNYWSATPDSLDTNLSHFFYLNSNYVIMYCYYKIVGLTVRPVIKQ